MKRRIFFVVSVLVMIMMFALAFFVPKKSNVEEKPFEQKPIVVSTQFVKERKSFFQEITYPASVVSEQESEVVARSSGTVVAIDASLGSYAHKGAFLAKIDDRGNFSSSVSETFQSEEIQRATLDAEKAEKAVDLFERRYQSLKKTYEEQEDDDTLSKTVTKDQVRAAKIEVDMAKIDEENVKVQLESMINNHIVTSPLGGYVTDIQVSVGDYVSAGETLMMLSQTNAIKIQFWVDQNHFQFLQKGSLVSFRDQYGNAHEAIVENISPRGEMISRRFLVEAIPKENSNNLILGSIITVEASFEKKTLKEENIFLPLSALTLGQNENSIFVVENSKARRVLVDIVRVDGEMAEVSARLSPESEIIVSGNKYVREGDEVVIVR